MNPELITPLILTWNEAPNIRRCLDRLTWARRIVVVDSGSTDETVAICREHPQVAVLVRPFDTHSAQWNFGVDSVDTPWVLSLDCDYLVPASFPAEVEALSERDEMPAYEARFRYCIHGHPLRGTLYPPRAVLFRRERCRYDQDGHTQALRVDGTVGRLRNPFDHDDRKPLARWVINQQRYAALEAEKLLGTGDAPGSLPDRLRRMIWPAAPAAFLYTLFAKQLILDGWPGLAYVLQRTFAEVLLSLELLERKLKSSCRPYPRNHHP